MKRPYDFYKEGWNACKTEAIQKAADWIRRHLVATDVFTDNMVGAFIESMEDEI